MIIIFLEYLFLTFPIIVIISLPTLPNGKSGNWVTLDENGLGLFKHKNKHFSLSLEDAKINS